MKHTAQFLSMVALAMVIALSPACNTSKTAKGAVIGGAAGGIIGGIIGKSTGNTAAGVIIGSAVGGSAGAVIGNYMDKQAEELDEELEAATVERVDEGIVLTFDSGLLFGYDSYQLTETTKTNLREMANVMQKYAETDIVIAGHTDSKGSEEYNQTLSERRAASVADFLKAQGISSARITTIGKGETDPIAPNTTESGADNPEGRAQNRRVEVVITANETLQKDAEDGTLENDPNQGN